MAEKKLPKGHKQPEGCGQSCVRSFRQMQPLRKHPPDGLKYLLLSFLLHTKCFKWQLYHQGAV